MRTADKDPVQWAKFLACCALFFGFMIAAPFAVERKWNQIMNPPPATPIERTIERIERAEAELAQARAELAAQP